MARLRSFILVGAVVGAVAATVRSLRRTGRNTKAPAVPPIEPRATPKPTTAPRPVSPRPPVTDPVQAAPDEPARTTPTAPDTTEETAVESTVEPAISEGPAATTATAWRPALDGHCPEGFPVKVKIASGIFHQPGGLSYDRTRPDRCYPDAASATADGFRPAKR